MRKFINVRDLDIDLIDRINPFEAAYAVLAKTMDEKSLRQIQASIAGKKINITEDEARELAKRALQFKNERGRVPDINSADAWEKRMAEGVAAFARYRAQAKAAQRRRREPPAMADLDDDELLEALGVEGRAHQDRRPYAPRRADHRGLRGHPALSRSAPARATARGGRDIFERLYAVRLDQLRKLPEAHAPAGRAGQAWPAVRSPATPINVDDLARMPLLAELGTGSEAANHADITVLRHVRSHAERQVAEDRRPHAVRGLRQVPALFERVERELQDGLRKAVPFKGEASVEQGNFFIVGGQFAYVQRRAKSSRPAADNPMHGCSSSTATQPRAIC